MAITMPRAVSRPTATTALRMRIAVVFMSGILAALLESGMRSP
jgi:hypothetical protein